MFMTEVNNHVEDKVLSIIETVTGINKDQLSDKLDSSIITDLGIDSLDRIDIINSIEDFFKLSIPDESIKNLKTISNIIDYIQWHGRF